jgi:glyoxylase-like metal-dependent hydrolase (beta-lactamase superfamily II)
MDDTLQIHTLVSMPFAENSYVVWRQGREQAVVFDPGLQPELILEFLQERGLKVAAVLNTHGHADHIGGNQAMKEAFPEAPIIAGERDAALLTDANLNMSAPFGMPIVSPPADQLVREGDILDVAGIRLEVLDIPGHSPGHVVFVWRGEPCRVFSGDVVFRGSVGRTDFPDGSADLLFQGIRSKLFLLPGDTVLYPGHGPTTTVEHEKHTNPFVGGF